MPGRPGLLDVPARVAEALVGWMQKAHTAVEMASAQKVAAERREREAKRKTPPAQQEFEPAWAAGEPAPTTTTTTTASASTSDPAPAPTPTRPRGAAEEFAP